MSWQSKKVLVTGAGGFIGSHLCEALLDQGAEVTAMLHYNSRGDWGNLEFLPDMHKEAVRVTAGNIEDSSFVDRQVNGKDVVFHLAALIGIPYSYMAPFSYVRTNVEGTINIMEAARKYGVHRVIHTSTSEIYGTAIYTPIDEKHPLQAQSPYSASKIGGDKVAESYFLAFDLPVTIILPFNSYGPRQSARAIIPTIVTQALSQKEILLGSLNPVRDLTYVRDTVQGFIRGAVTGLTVGKTINIGFGKGITIGDLAKTILSLMGCDKPIVLERNRIRPEKSEVLELVCDNTKAIELTGWKPEYSLEEGLTETIEFISKNQWFYKADRYAI